MGRTLWTSLVWTALSIGLVNPYRYIDGDQAITIPFAKRLIDPELYPGDYLLEQQQYYLTYLWHAVAGMTDVLGVSLETSFFVVYAACLFATFAAARAIALALFDREDVALLTPLLLLFPTSMPGDIRPLDALLLTRGAARPLVLFGIASLLRRRPTHSAALLGLGLLIHPMSAAQAVLLLLPGAPLVARETGWRPIAIGALVFGVLAVPLVLWRHSAGAGAPLGHVDPHWLELLRLRSWWHIFPSAWPARVAAIAFGLALFGVARRWAQPGFARALATRIVLAGVGLWIAGTVFVELVPVAAVLQAQLFRSSAIVWFVVVPFLVHAAVRQLHAEHDAAPGPKTIATAAAFVLWPLLPTHWYVPAAFALGAAALRVSALRERSTPTRWAAAVCATCVLANLAVKGLPESRRPKHDADWIEAQTWVRENTAKDALVVVPAESSAFRVGAERSTYVDYKDGTLTNFNPRFAVEWERRLEGLVGPFQAVCADPKACSSHLASRYDAATPETLARIAAEVPAVPIYVVVRATAATEHYPVAHANGSYHVLALRGPIASP